MCAGISSSLFQHFHYREFYYLCSVLFPALWCWGWARASCQLAFPQVLPTGALQDSGASGREKLAPCLLSVGFLFASRSCQHHLASTFTPADSSFQQQQTPAGSFSNSKRTRFTVPSLETPTPASTPPQRSEPGPVGALLKLEDTAEAEGQLLPSG